MPIWILFPTLPSKCWNFPPFTSIYFDDCPSYRISICVEILAFKTDIFWWSSYIFQYGPTIFQIFSHIFLIFSDGRLHLLRGHPWPPQPGPGSRQFFQLWNGFRSATGGLWPVFDGEDDDIFWYFLIFADIFWYLIWYLIWYFLIFSGYVKIAIENDSMTIEI